MRFPAILSILLFATPALAQAPPCEGTYEMIEGYDTLSAPPGWVTDAYNTRQGMIGTIPMHLNAEGTHEIEVNRCGRQVVLSGNFNMVLHQSALDGTEYVGHDPNEARAEMTVNIADRKNMVGKIEISVRGATATFPFTLQPRDISMPDMKGCQDDILGDDPEPDDDRLAVDPALRSEAMDIVADEIGLPRAQASRYLSAPETVSRTQSASNGPTIILPGEPGCPEEFAGIRTCHAYPPDTHRIVEINMLLDEDGRLLPVATTPQGRIYVDEPDAADYCSLERSLPPAARFVRMTFFGLERDDVNNVQAILADARTGIFEKGHLAERQTRSPKGGAITSRQQRADATAEAYDGIGSPITGRH